MRPTCADCGRTMRTSAEPKEVGVLIGRRGRCNTCRKRTIAVDVVAGPSDTRLEDLIFLAETGESLYGACKRIGMQPEGVRRLLNRKRRSDVYRTLAARNPINMEKDAA